MLACDANFEISKEVLAFLDGTRYNGDNSCRRVTAARIRRGNCHADAVGAFTGIYRSDEPRSRARLFHSGGDV